MKTMLLLFTIILLYGCETGSSNPQKITIEQSNSDYNITLLFEVDSVKVYRFSDGGRDVYFSNSQDRIDYNYTTRIGKTGVIDHSQTTLTNQVKDE